MTDIPIEDMTSEERGALIQEADGLLLIGYVCSPVPVLATWFFPSVWTIGLTLLGLCGFLVMRAQYKKAKWIEDKSDFEFIRDEIEKWGRDSTKQKYTSELREYEKSGGRFAKFRKKQ